ncbi:hypothetical protein KC333_g8017 [Hortaea werneckii]|nr:hypothetical protein KC342_g11866 [Hortaea werneckii]KAI6854192.1 hypothetical protein KC323_g8933 [Hortaea werneckii]KAI6855981.1 hypothetical protein KC338_g8651 [Hortaea werneckii]KAI7067106.1 hypothetical protein KC339_g15352 [Hortaea werneckii]KAI7210816.1 hypothetical protein KC333_g8017 [Hortaea werneckii]
MILTARERGKQSGADDRRFRQVRKDYLADESLNDMSRMISLLEYCKSIAIRHNNARAISFSLDRQMLHYCEKVIHPPLFGQVDRDVIPAAEDMLWAKLIWTPRSDRFEMPLDKPSDDVTETKEGISFVTHEHSRLSNKRTWMLERAHAHGEGRKLRRGQTWD